MWPIGQTVATPIENWPLGLRLYSCCIGSHRRRHLCLPLTWCFGKCLTAVAARFVSRTASFPTTSGSPQCSDLAYLGQYAWGATGNENMQRGMRRYSLSVDSHLSCPDALLSTALMAAFSRFVHPGDSQFRVHSLNGACRGCRRRGA
jgi:hypothetical protein